MRGLPT
jgi:hypothetical protein